MAGSEYASSNAWVQGFTSGFLGFQTSYTKTNVKYVRAFRRLAL